MRFIALFTLSLLALSRPVLAGPDPDPGNIDTSYIVNRYLTARESAQSTLRGMQMEVDIDASLPRLKKQGKLHALRSISKVGLVTYHVLRFSGDSTIKKEVIARYLTTENQPRDGSIAISPANYKFHYKGLANRDGRRVYQFQLSPRRKAVGLFKGDLWIDAQTYLPVRESGRFVKNPSVFLKKVEFVREYEIRDGVAIPRHIESMVDTRVVGRAELSINFSNYSKQPAATPAVPVSGGGSQ
ncbi:MAG: hypothetical protein ABI165_05360 [Bryobacteraceae bacterium]